MTKSLSIIGGVKRKKFKVVKKKETNIEIIKLKRTMHVVAKALREAKCSNKMTQSKLFIKVK